MLAGPDHRPVFFGLRRRHGLPPAERVLIFLILPPFRRAGAVSKIAAARFAGRQRPRLKVAPALTSAFVVRLGCRRLGGQDLMRAFKPTYFWSA